MISVISNGIHDFKNKIKQLPLFSSFSHIFRLLQISSHAAGWRRGASSD